MPTHIMVVDDDAANLRAAGHILSKNQMQVTALSSGAALLDAIRPGKLPDLILLDINMPEMDGFETLKLLRKKEQALDICEIPVIFLTADETADTEKLGFEAGVSDYIRKPFDPDILLRRVGNVVSKEQRLSFLRNEADTDKLTGFLNKGASARVMNTLCASDLGCLLMIDLDSFKLVNDLYGHKMGDNVLICFAAILRGAVPEGSRIGRIGGDEFVAFASGVQTMETVGAFTRRINTELVAKAKELMGADMDIPLGASVGCVFVPQHGDSYDALLRLADQALYSVKKNGKHSFALYQAGGDADPSLHTAAQSIGKLSEILGERSIPNVALQLDKESFAYVYRYIMRYMVRNQRHFYKVLFTLDPEEGAEYADYKTACDAFGDHIRESLRKTDILMRSRFNQYFVLLTDICENHIDIVTGKILRRWEQSGGTGIGVTFETEFVSMPSRLPQQTPQEIRIAVVDDDESNLRLAGTALSKAGFRVSAMKSGQTLLKYLTENTPDLILLDVNMPGMDGFETMRQLRCTKSAAEIPVVFLTADENRDTEQSGLALGAEDFIRKPFLPELLIRRIRRITELSALQHQPNSLKQDEERTI